MAADCGKRVVFWISVRISFGFQVLFLYQHSPLFEFLYQDGHVLVQKQNPKSKKKSERNPQDNTFSAICSVSF
jgi:hypothetical protein